MDNDKTVQWLPPTDWLAPIVYNEYSGFPDEEESKELSNELKQTSK